MNKVDNLSVLDVKGEAIVVSQLLYMQTLVKGVVHLYRRGFA